MSIPALQTRGSPFALLELLAAGGPAHIDAVKRLLSQRHASSNGINEVLQYMRRAGLIEFRLVRITEKGRAALDGAKRRAQAVTP